MATRPRRHTFRTLNNLKDPTELSDDEMSVAENVNIHDDSSISLRKGRTLALSATAPHSFWAHPDGEAAYFVEGSSLKKFNVDETATVLYALSNNDRMAFEVVNNIVIFANGEDIGYIQEDTAALFDSPTDQHKVAVVTGSFLAFFKGRLYILNEDGLHYTDVNTVDQMDERNNLFPLLGEPTMLAALDNGLWVGKGAKTIWLGGTSPEEFDYHEFDDAIVPGTSVILDSPKRSGFKATGRHAVWVSGGGIVLGTNGGTPTVLTEGTLAVKPSRMGSAILRKQGGLTHFVAALQDTDTEDNKFTPAAITVDSQTTGG